MDFTFEYVDESICEDCNIDDDELAEHSGVTDHISTSLTDFQANGSRFLLSDSGRCRKRNTSFNRDKQDKSPRIWTGNSLSTHKKKEIFSFEGTDSSLRTTRNEISFMLRILAKLRKRRESNSQNDSA